MAVSINTRRLFSVNNAHSNTNIIPAINPHSLIANGIPTIPAPMMALTKLDVAPATDDLCSLALVDSFLILRVVPPGVEIWMSLRGVDGAKKGDAGGFMPPPLLLPPFAMVGVGVGFWQGSIFVVEKKVEAGRGEERRDERKNLPYEGSRSWSVK